MSYMTDQIKSKLNAVFASALYDLPASGRVSFRKSDAEGRVDVARGLVKSLAVEYGFDFLTPRVDEVFDALTERYSYLPEFVEVDRASVDAAVAHLVDQLVALTGSAGSSPVSDPTPVEADDDDPDFDDPYEDPIVDEIHDPYYDDFEPAYYDDGFGPVDPVVIDISQFLQPIEPAPVATITADLWGVRASLTVEGRGAEIEFDGTTLLVTL